MKTISIIGLGMIGGSIAAAAKRHKICDKVVGCDTNIHVLQQASERGLIDDYYPDIKSAIKTADIIFIAAPLGQYKNIFCEIAEHISGPQIITDVGSAKVEVIEDAKKILDNCINRFVPGHPLAGSEKSGINGVEDDLFKKKRVVLTPILNVTAQQAIEVVTQFWQSLQAEVTIMDPYDHDKAVSVLSHLPHVISFCYANVINNFDDLDKFSNLPFKSYKEMSRIAASNPIMWNDIFLSNRDNLIASIEQFESCLRSLKQAVVDCDNKAIKDFIADANALL